MVRWVLAGEDARARRAAHLAGGVASRELRPHAGDAINEKKKNADDTGHRIIRICTHQEDNKIVMTVSDTGIGIKKELLGKIFDSFFTTKESIKGVGLGLSVCYGFIQDHGGDIRVSSQVGERTTFTIILPEYSE